MNDLDQTREAKRQLRDLTAYVGQPGNKTKKEKPPIESYTDIIDQKPSIKKVREYYEGVAANISEMEQDFGGL